MEDRFGGEVIRNQIRVRSERRIFPAEMIRVPAAFTESPGEETFNFGTACFDGRWSGHEADLVLWLAQCQPSHARAGFPALKLGKNGQHAGQRSPAWWLNQALRIKETKPTAQLFKRASRAK